MSVDILGPTFKQVEFKLHSWDEEMLQKSYGRVGLMKSASPDNLKPGVYNNGIYIFQPTLQEILEGPGRVLEELKFHKMPITSQTILVIDTEFSGNDFGCTLVMHDRQLGRTIESHYSTLNLRNPQPTNPGELTPRELIMLDTLTDWAVRRLAFK